MNKLEVGMYVRTKYGIAKYVHKAVTKTTIYYVVDKKIVYENVEGWEDSLLSNEILKASHNIIDLIEVGDYVNGYLIDYINLTCETPFLRSERPYRVDNTLYSTLKEKGRDYNQPLHFYNEDIKSIVTKEQFSSMEYRLGDK